MIAASEAEAQRLVREVNDLSDPEVGRKRLSGRFGGHDFSNLPLDRPLAPEDFPRPETVEAARSRTEVIINLVRRDRPTLRQLLGYLAGARGHYVTAGTPEQIADLIEDWFTAGAADGFNIMPPLLPAQLDAFSSGVIPRLQRRGLFRTEYTGMTLREHYALPLPTSVFDDPAWTAELRETAAGVLTAAGTRDPATLTQPCSSKGGPRAGHSAATKSLSHCLIQINVHSTKDGALPTRGATFDLRTMSGRLYCRLDAAPKETQNPSVHAVSLTSSHRLRAPREHRASCNGRAVRDGSPGRPRRRVRPTPARFCPTARREFRCGRPR